MRKIERWAVWALAAALCAAAPPTAHGQRRTSREPERSDDNRIIEERNIFLRDRSTPRERPTVQQPRPAPRPERDIVLTGIVSRGDDYVAFFENRRTGTTDRLRQGDALLRGRVAGIGRDYVLVAYGNGDQEARLELGMALDGAAPASGSSSPPASASAPASATPSAAPGAATDRASILERLRQQRQREMNQ